MKRNVFILIHCLAPRVEKWIDLNLFGHQLVCHEVDVSSKSRPDPVDGHDVPIPHFGVILEMSVWKSQARKLEAAGVSFVIEPYIRFEGQTGEQGAF